jgi:hypothetical protein
MPKIRLYCTIRWLAGGSYSDIYMFAGISKASFYRICWQTIHAICKCDQLKIHFPETLEECQVAAVNFVSISRGNAITNCVSIIDGYLMEIEATSRETVGNVRAYFSRHHQRYGVNIQACCDHLSCFTYIGLAGPGVMNDNQAIYEISIGEKIANLPFAG